MKKLLKIWMAVCTVLITAFLLAAAGYYIWQNLWPHSPAAQSAPESCLDSGGTWDADQKICIHAS